MGPLQGVKVLDISFYAPTRYASMFLADLGADVITIEMRRADRARPYKILDSDVHRRWIWYQRNKKSITLNLKTEEGKKIFYRLAEQSDIILEGFEVGTARRLGVDYESVKKVNPGISYCSITGFGQDGPYAQLLGHEQNYEAIGGVLGQTGERGGPPALTGGLPGDICGGSGGALIGVLSALVHRMKTGEGQYIDVSITDGVLPTVGGEVYNLIMTGEEPPRGEGVGTGGRPQQAVYRTRDGGYISLTALERWTFEKLCRALDRMDLLELYREEPGGGDELRRRLAEIFATRTRDEWTQWNLKENVTVMPVLSLTEVMADPHMLHRKMIVEMDYEPMGKIKQIGIPVKFSKTPGEIKWMPRYGQHTAEAMAGLGYSGEDIRRLREQGIIE